VTRAKRRYLLALVEGRVCEWCRLRMGAIRRRTFVSHVLCGTCFAKAKEALARGEEI
jgi:hypothetical protein